MSEQDRNDVATVYYGVPCEAIWRWRVLLDAEQSCAAYCERENLMPRRVRPEQTSRSEHWMRVAVNDQSAYLNKQIAAAFEWRTAERIEWRSPLASDGYAEYFDESFLERLGVTNLRVPLAAFWPRSGPRWDALGRTASGKLILVEAKAYIEEGIDYSSKASEASMKMIRGALSAAKSAFRASERAAWEQPFYQYANRLAHLYFLHAVNDRDVYLVFLYFADAPDVPFPASAAEWRGASRVTAKALGIEKHPFQHRVATLIVSVPSMIGPKGEIGGKR